MSQSSWTYATLTWSHTATGTGSELSFESKWLIRYGHDAVEVERPATDVLADVLADLGRDGWELVGETVQSYAQVPKTGYPTATTPLRVRWVLKRPITG